MSEWTQTDRQIGMSSAITVVAIVVVYLITGLIGVVARSPGSRTLISPFRIEDPV